MEYTEAEKKRLQYIKDANGITGEFHDAALKNHMSEAMYYLEAAGVPASVLESDKALGVISRGTMDLWNYGAGDGQLSPYFYQRGLQLKYEKVTEGASV